MKRGPTTMKNYMNKRRAGFTLIELMIVIGIIAVLVVVLAVAVLPALSKSDESATRTMLQDIGAQICGQQVVPTVAKFRKDASDLSGRIASDDKMASSQMMLFYTAPDRSTWDSAKYYKGQNYNPKQQPEQYLKFTREQGGGLPFLVDAWENPIWYEYDKTVKAGFVLSRGKDGEWNTTDDLIYDSRNTKVVKREELNQ